jgi:ABC-type multidrug transport system fused ATPase/permease subunit
MESILVQDEEWFDKVNPEQLATQLNTDSASIKQALGDKMGNLTFSFSMCATGLVIGGFYGWKFSLIMLVLFPVVTISVHIFSKGS